MKCPIHEKEMELKKEDKNYILYYCKKCNIVYRI